VTDLLTRDQLLAPREVPLRKLEIPSMGGHVYVKGMTAKERGLFERSFENADGTKNKKRVSEVRQRMVIACCCNESRIPYFTLKDMEMLGNQELNVIEEIVVEAQKLCGMTDDDIEELAGNLDGIEEAS